LRRIAGIALAALAAVCLAGCGGGSTSMGGLLSGAGSLFGGSPKIAVAPIIGAPESVTKELTQALIVAGNDRNLTLMPGTEGANYTLRGYLLAAPERQGSKISYIWDVTDAEGTRVTRVSGEETAARGTSSNPWRGVDDKVIRSIANNTTSQLAADLPGGRSASSPSVAAAPAAATTATAAAAAAKPAPAPKPSGVVVGPVTGAPGDGSRSLATALKKKLYADGVKLVNGTSGNVYTVKGIVKLTDAGGSKEKIQIDWQVLDPNGKRLGTVSQQNTIPKGSLNGPWGAIADAAAGAAADGIVKLLPKSS
jgi:hypothetical protein